MVERPLKVERLELAQKYASAVVAVASFWVIAFYWNHFSVWNLEPVPRLGFGAAISWIVFLHAEVAGMIIMTMMKEKWREEAQEAREEARELREMVREAQAQQQAREEWDREREAREEAREEREAAREEAREAREEAREAREAARYAQTQELILGLMRMIESSSERGENANGGKA